MQEKKKAGRPKNPVNKVTAKRLRELRLEKHLTQEALANAIGYEKVTIARYENEIRGINNEDLKRLADFFDVPIPYLLGETGCRTWYQYQLEQEDIEADAIAEHQEEEHRKAKYHEAFFAVCGHKYENLGYTPAEFDSLGLHRLTSIDHPSISVRLSDSELEDLLSVINDSISFYCFRKMEKTKQE